MAMTPEVSDLVNKIKTEQSAKKMRGFIADGLQKTNEETTYTSRQLQNVIDETTGKDFTSAPEIIAARKGKPNLNARLDSFEQSTTAQFQQKAEQRKLEETNEALKKKIGDGVKAEPEDLSATTLGLIKGGTVELNTIPQNESVTEAKLAPPMKKDLLLMCENKVIDGGAEVGIYDGAKRNGVQMNGNNGDKYFVSAEIKLVGSGYVKSSFNGKEVITLDLVKGVYKRNSYVGIYSSSETSKTAGFFGSPTLENKMRNFFVVNLTKTFGAGKEPDVLKMDKLLSKFPSKWFDGTENLFNAELMITEFIRSSAFDEYMTAKNEAWGIV